MTGRAICFALCAIAAVLSIPAASWTGLPTWLSLACSSAAFVAMALNQFLATRPRFAEGLFGGLDQIYRTHRHLGVLAFALILIHFFLTPDFQGKQLASDLNKLAKNVGMVGFIGLMALIFVSILKRIPFTKIETPYHWWRWSHRLIGVFFCLIAFHQFFIKRPFAGDAWLANYLAFFAVLGVLSYLWTEFTAVFRRRKYQVTSVARLPAATVIEARPLGRPIRVKPGQFAFLSFVKSGLREPHPFTVAGYGADGSVRFAIKPLGDFTRRLRDLAAVGDEIRVEGGYGRFVHLRGGDRQVWLAGGIGITPFLAMASSLKAEDPRKIMLVHCVRDESEAVEAEKLHARAAELPNFSFRLHKSSEAGRLEAAGLKQAAPFDLNGADLWFCGPPMLRTAMAKGLSAAGVKIRRLEFERFEFR
ncbi:ferric reductase-like transmembrane domain-containing protein [Chelatococcus sambhunathii]|uniref:Ferric reductase-like transmembrane domain-containing protein n=1 Tax=Chelatococcus sambhunathii TaxID=363953 RepID=A0ABU1DET1_9HYPH|nr:ferric reductase-like transmembrane domain-containing protein [Chelatococcus sambhunathii]MDR4306633.1 ferric reductase-like transmembrane domain-containing protein [Chelatococcus sambhunathii]